MRFLCHAFVFPSYRSNTRFSDLSRSKPRPARFRRLWRLKTFEPAGLQDAASATLPNSGHSRSHACPADQAWFRVQKLEPSLPLNPRKGLPFFSWRCVYVCVIVHEGLGPRRCRCHMSLRSFEGAASNLLGSLPPTIQP